MWYCRDRGSFRVEPVFKWMKLDKEAKLEDAPINYYKCRHCGDINESINRLAKWEEKDV